MIMQLLGGVRATIFAGIAALALTFSGVQSVRLDHAQDKVAEMRLAQSKANEKHQRELREKETQMAEALRQAKLKSIQEQKDAKENHDRALAAVRAGKLRNRFSCPRPPDDSGAPSGASGEERRGLLEEDAAFLISEAHRADLIAIERNELIDIVVELRKLLNER